MYPYSSLLVSVGVLPQLNLALETVGRNRLRARAIHKKEQFLR